MIFLQKVSNNTINEFQQAFYQGIIDVRYYEELMLELHNEAYFKHNQQHTSHRSCTIALFT